MVPGLQCTAGHSHLGTGGVSSQVSREAGGLLSLSAGPFLPQTLTSATCPLERHRPVTTTATTTWGASTAPAARATFCTRTSAPAQVSGCKGDPGLARPHPPQGRAALLWDQEAVAFLCFSVPSLHPPTHSLQVLPSSLSPWLTLIPFRLIL